MARPASTKLQAGPACPVRLGADQRALQQHEELIGQKFGLLGAGAAAEGDQILARVLFALLDHAACRMPLFRQFDRGIGERAAA